jgi:hypothetical protein
MKTFQKIALVSAIAAAPFAAQAELVSMDEALMGNTTGQAGVTIEINIEEEITIGSVTYTDTDADGSAVLERIAIGNVTDLVQTIDINGDGDLVMGMSAVDNMTIGLGVDKTDATTTAATQGFSAVMLQGSDGTTRAELVNNLSMQVDLGASTTTIHNLAAGTGAGNTGTLADAGASGTYGLQTAAMAIQMVQDVRIDNLDVGLFGYTQAQAEGGVAAAGIATYATGFTNLVDQNANGLADEQLAYTSAMAADANANGIIELDEGAGFDGQAAYTLGVATGAAIEITGFEFYQDTLNNADGTTNAGGNAKDYARIKQTVWAQGGSSVLGGGVYVQIEEIKGTIDIASIAIGGSSIGSVQIKDLNLAGLTQRIYGH